MLDKAEDLKQKRHPNVPGCTGRVIDDGLWGKKTFCKEGGWHHRLIIESHTRIQVAYAVCSTQARPIIPVWSHASVDML